MAAHSKDSGSGFSVRDELMHNVEPNLSLESIKQNAESAGFEKIGDEVLGFLAEDVSFRLKEIVQDAFKFCRNGKRAVLTASDIDNSLRARNIEPLYGFTAADFIPFRFASGGGREVHFYEDAEIDLEDVLGQALPKLPLELSVKAHWLAVEGIQPSIPENPPPVDKNQQLQDVVEPTEKSSTVTKIGLDSAMSLKRDATGSSKDSGKSDAKDKKKVVEQDSKKSRRGLGPSLSDKSMGSKLKPLLTHELSVEQQMYYREITEACVGSNEVKRTEALQSLATDPGLYQLVPRFAAFIAEGIKINVGQHNLALLIYLLRMTKSLLDNNTIYLEKYLHELIPAVLTCMISRQLCPRPETDNHWALRDFAARLMAQICRSFGSTTNSLQSRVTKALCKALFTDAAPLALHYGAVVGLAELGLEVLRVLVLPRLKVESASIQSAIIGTDPVEKQSASNLSAVLVKHCSLVIYKTRSQVESVEHFVSEFGYLGHALHDKVAQLRQSTPIGGRTPSTPHAVGV